MKKIITVLSFIILSNISYSQEKKTIDPKLVGCWKGNEMGQQLEGINKYWVSCRFENGTSVLLFVSIDKFGEVNQHTENGKWWIENGKYYELHNFDGITDIYEYEVIEDHIKFKSLELLGKKDTTYSFEDYKIEDD